MKITKFMVLALAIASALTFAGCEEEEEKKAKCWFAFWNNSSMSLYGIKFGPVEMKPFPADAESEDLTQIDCGAYYVEVFNNTTQAYEQGSEAQLGVPSNDHIYELEMRDYGTNNVIFYMNDWGNINDLPTDSISLKAAKKAAAPQVIGSFILPSALVQYLIK